MPKTKKSEKFPQTLFVTREEPANDDAWLMTHTDLDTTVEVGEVTEVAEYRLVGIKKVRAEIKAE